MSCAAMMPLQWILLLVLGSQQGSQEPRKSLPGLGGIHDAMSWMSRMSPGCPGFQDPGDVLLVLEMSWMSWMCWMSIYLLKYFYVFQVL